MVAILRAKCLAYFSSQKAVSSITSFLNARSTTQFVCHNNISIIISYMQDTVSIGIQVVGLGYHLHHALRTFPYSWCGLCSSPDHVYLPCRQCKRPAE